MIIGEVKHYNFSDLQAISYSKTVMEIQETLLGRLFHGTIVEGSEKQPALVKTWDYLMSLKESMFTVYINFVYVREIDIFGWDEGMKVELNLQISWHGCMRRGL
ncbi:hypothetical protein HAX54_012789 [Datura stramonium]|uniref:Uncharacterized protein n=1 Tax=Datura stramonium TaxID=4076 RepID=A0ABS8TN63_DATST|nr:hypothetical protein [Datura stramonium]